MVRCVCEAEERTGFHKPYTGRPGGFLDSMRVAIVLAVLLLIGSVLAGCLQDVGDLPSGGESEHEDRVPYLDYDPSPIDAALGFVQESHLIPGHGGTEIQVRLVIPDGEGPFPVVTQFTPYTAPGTNVHLDALAEPVLGEPSESFITQFTKRGFVYAHGDVRGTGDSSGCLDLRGDLDIADLYALTEWLGTQSWSNGNVGFIGGSYPGSEAHMAAIAGNEHVKAVVPVVASTSFYHYHHNSGVPYSGQHSLGGTNTGYTSTALTPTVNPQNTNFLLKYIEQATCTHHESMVDHGGLDQTGAYYPWWQERNLRDRVDQVNTPVLMAQGLQDWNVKPDHIATWFNDLQSQKVLVATQLGHAWPQEAEGAYGDWWEYVAAFFDTFLKEEDTGMFQEDVAWVADTNGEWHRSANWPLLPEERDELVLHFTSEKKLLQEPAHEEATLGWLGCPRDELNMGNAALSIVESEINECEDVPSSQMQVVFETEPFDERLHISGVPQVHLTLVSESDFTHLVAVVERLDANGDVVESRMNYGYLNPTFRDGLENPQSVPTGTAYNVTIDLYPQEDIVEPGDWLRVTLRSHDGGRTIEAFEEGVNEVLIGPGHENWLLLPLRPADQQGVRLD